MMVMELEVELVGFVSEYLLGYGWGVGKYVVE